MTTFCAQAEFTTSTLSGTNPLINKQLDQQCSIKPRKKKTHNTDDSLESEDDSVKIRIGKKKEVRRYTVPTERRNLGSPVIVETVSKSNSSFNVLDVLNRNPKLRDERVRLKANFKIPKAPGTVAEASKACIIVAESIDPCPKEENVEKRSSTPRAIKSSTRARRSQETADDWGPTVSPSKTFEDFLEHIKLNTSVEGSSSLQLPETDISMLNNNTIQDDQYPIRLYSLRNKVLVIMPKETSLTFVGKIIVRVIRGAVEANGYPITVETGPMEIYCPRGYSSISIKSNETFPQEIQPDIWQSLSAEGIHRDVKNKMVADLEEIQADTTVILLASLDNKLTNFFQAFYSFRLFPHISSKGNQFWTDRQRAEKILRSKLYIGNNSCIDLQFDENVIRDIKEKMLNNWRENKFSCTLVAGGKSVGKSSTVRYLINSLLPTSKMVVLVNLDIGQPESTLPGCISYSLVEKPLMGPNFTYLKDPVFQLYIGDISVVRCLARYFEAVKMLADRLSSCPVVSKLPIVVNTMGFNRGIGWDIANFIIRVIQPSLVLQIMSENAKNNFQDYLSKEVINAQAFELSWFLWRYNLIIRSELCNHELLTMKSYAERKKPNSGNKNWNMEPSQKRELVLISYLSQIVQNPVNIMSCNNNFLFYLSQAEPYVAPFSSLTISIPRASVPPSHVLNVVNGNIVALCGIDTKDVQSSMPVPGLRVLNGLPLATCYGFGIVRGVDVEREQVYIISGLPAVTMQCVNCLVGSIPLPVSLLQANQQGNVPYIGGTNDLPTSREHRRGTFRMRYENRETASS